MWASKCSVHNHRDLGSFSYGVRVQDGSNTRVLGEKLAECWVKIDSAPCSQVSSRPGMLYLYTVLLTKPGDGRLPLCGPGFCVCCGLLTTVNADCNVAVYKPMTAYCVIFSKSMKKGSVFDCFHPKRGPKNTVKQMHQINVIQEAIAQPKWITPCWGANAKEHVTWCTDLCCMYVVPCMLLPLFRMKIIWQQITLFSSLKNIAQIAVIN